MIKEKNKKERDEKEEAKSAAEQNGNNISADIEKEVEKTKLQIENLEKEKDALRDQLLRKAAEFENYKRRTETEQTNLLKYSSESIIAKLLPIIDDLERSLKHMDDAKDLDSIKNGVKMIYDKFMRILDAQGVKKIEAAGKPFDVDFHEALMQQKSDGVEPHTVLEEVESGYIYKDRVIRHAKVIVSEESSDENTND
ncbi:MAG: nucleotide exchange factor GrpE [Ignavibacteria bacterium CG2_30_36_16]|nr:nucleotide exchange factor GrpE [Ignavibacteria bacterium]OIP61745.1 MAG: nucleotide exchange factor GrpE [Ignavibacteria bacterium CG2_30_36_16]PJB00987.1 MAG: nucleotide exchange factor GrpE [Ignavibacteria bacterium CG_4_9_14_3_um_filter_36_18]